MHYDPEGCYLLPLVWPGSSGSALLFHSVTHFWGDLLHWLVFLPLCLSLHCSHSLYLSFLLLSLWWTQCTTSCGPGYQMRAVKCVVGSYGSVMDDTECNAATRPTDTQVRTQSTKTHLNISTTSPHLLCTDLDNWHRISESNVVDSFSFCENAFIYCPWILLSFQVIFVRI